MQIYPIIQKPCSKNWHSLQGDQKQRFCSECKHHVHNLNFMTESEQATLLKKPGRHCVVYTDNTHVIKIDISRWNFLGHIRAVIPFGHAIVAFAVTFLFTACATTSRKDTSCCPPSAPAFQGSSQEDGKSFMSGGIVVVPERPLWKRILWPFN